MRHSSPVTASGPATIRRYCPLSPHPQVSRRAVRSVQLCYRTGLLRCRPSPRTLTQNLMRDNQLSASNHLHITMSSCQLAIRPTRSSGLPGFGPKDLPHTGKIRPGSSGCPGVPVSRCPGVPVSRCPGVPVSRCAARERFPGVGRRCCRGTPRTATGRRRPGGSVSGPHSICGVPARPMSSRG